MVNGSITSEFPQETNVVENLIKEGRKEEAFKEASPYVINLSRKFYVRGLDREDIENEALYALWRAIETYNSKMKFRFKTYMGKVVINKMMELIRSMTRDKRDDTLSSTEELATVFSTYKEPKIDLKLDLEYFITKYLPIKYSPFWRESIRCGSFEDGGRNLGYTNNETRHLRNVVIRMAREALGIL